MTTKELIKHLSKFPEDVDVLMEFGGNAMYLPIGVPYVRNIGTCDGFHRDCVCIGRDIKDVLL